MKFRNSMGFGRHRFYFYGETGFSLLEIMVSVAILAISMLVILNMHSGTLLTSGRAEDVTTASMLARLKLHEIQLDLEKDLTKGGFPSDNKEIEGRFDEPYEKYSWKAGIKKVEIPVPPQPENEGGEEAGQDMMFMVFKLISERIAEGTREIRLKIIWEELGEEQTLTATTHVVKL